MMRVKKAGLLFQVLGQYLPEEVYSHLSHAEIEALLLAGETSKKPSPEEEKHILSLFNKKLGARPTPVPSIRQNSPPPSDRQELMELLESLLPEEEPQSLVKTLPQKDLESLRRLLRDEDSLTVARVLSFADPEAAAQFISEAPPKVQEEILLSIGQVDFHSTYETEALERFLSFKMALLEQNLSTGKIKDRKGKKAGELLNRLPSQPSQNLIHRIQKKSPKFAETVIEHYYRIEDILDLGRVSLTKFLSEIHPLVIACALKGLEVSFRDQLYALCEPWLVKEIRLEFDSLGPISIAEIEAAQTGIIERLSQDVEEGRIKLWRVK